jgi:hypothetical protein
MAIKIIKTEVDMSRREMTGNAQIERDLDQAIRKLTGLIKSIEHCHQQIAACKDREMRDMMEQKCAEETEKANDIVDWLSSNINSRQVKPEGKPGQIGNPRSQYWKRSSVNIYW